MDTLRESPPEPEPGHGARSSPSSAQGADGLPWWRRITVPFEVVIASVVVSAMLLLTVVLVYQVGTSAREAIIAASDDSARHISQLISERVHHIVDPADATIRLLAFDPIASATSLQARLRRLPVFARLLEQNPLLSAVFIGYADGQFLLVRPLRDAQLRTRLDAPAQAAFLLQSMARERGTAGLVGRWSYYDAQLRLLESSVRPGYLYDPRSRPWYAEAADKNTQILTAPYVFFTTQEVGVTLSQPSEDGRAVIGLDVALTDLGREIGSLRLMPRTEIAVVDPAQRVLAYPDMSRVLLREGGETSLKLRTLKELGVPSLQALGGGGTAKGPSRRFMADGEEWLATVLPLKSQRWQGLHILMAIPTAELLADVNQNLWRQVWLSLGLIVLMLPVGWMAGRRVGRSLSGLATQAQALARFDFRRPAHRLSPVREVRELGQVMDRMSDTIQEFLHITHHISAESRMELMLSSVLYELVRATSCTGGAVYLVEEQRAGLLRTARYCEDPEHQPRYPEHLPMVHFINHAEPQPGDQEEGDGDAMPQRVLRVQLRTRDGQPLGLLVLRYLSDPRQEDVHFRAFVEKLSGTLSVAIETRGLIEGQKKLFDAVIRLLADAIDAKSPYTGGHCERVPQLAESLMQRMCEAKEGPFAQVAMTDAERYEFRLGAWLHDCGKVTSPEHIIDKATKLEALYNRIHEVRMRFEVLWRDAELDYWKQHVSGVDPVRLQRELLQRRDRLQEEFAFVARCNVGGEFMADADVQRLAGIARQVWQRHFDDRLGLSMAEMGRLADVPVRPLPANEPLLADRAEHIVPWGSRRPPVEAGNPANKWGFDMALPSQEAHLGELHNLSIRRGTLTAEDRFKINDHIVQTIVMLSGLPFPPHLARVPSIAGSHHEKLDGTGYPRRLKAAQLTLADRVMTLADIFEALTAADRPYKAPKTLSESLRIMAHMVRDRHIDAEVFRFFLSSGVWLDYAERFLPAAQRDAVDVPALVASLD
ncbi:MULTISPECIES: HD domain-containing phosphohydrolase [unclassified Acidovorax]|uniref:HD domain-containing phosphohydrolase n=1 Tax=unclassified Acidovorax TaxID=2684926 RepID=UPI001C490DE9|nr:MULTISPECIES: HD domain-containing phosphohydrolase [unclassified Acidovorax]MBV7426857.1 phosphohydrolase [Acidovorax sp. sif0732]MBV7447982.1 phosphohydrolase [Acidovorax sp. sif0715]